MSARDLRPLFIALLFGVSASAHSQTNLPEGAGREIVQSKCAGCHELGRVLRSGYSAQDWRTVVHMMNNVGAQVPDEQLPILVKYLAENFPETAILELGKKTRLLLAGSFLQPKSHRINDMNRSMLFSLSRWLSLYSSMTWIEVILFQ